jgi:hypothetical protein
MTETRNRNANLTTVSAPESVDAPEWIVKMRAYREATGLYRAEDLNRGLGDPRIQVRGESAPDLLLVSCAKIA